jgi:hypothetical protein
MIVIRALRPQRCARFLVTVPSQSHTSVQHDDTRVLALEQLQPQHLGLHVQVTCNSLQQQPVGSAAHHHLNVQAHTLWPSQLQQPRHMSTDDLRTL